MDTQQLTNEIITLGRQVERLVAEQENMNENIKNFICTSTDCRAQVNSNTIEIAKLDTRMKVYGALFVALSGLLGGTVGSTLIDFFNGIQ